MRLGLFGGSFDPVHCGHLLLADACRAGADLREVWFVPAATQPHKPRGPVASSVDRVAMLRLAAVGRPWMQVSTVEIERGGVSYTIDTLRAIRAQQPGDELLLVLGADALADLPTWREPDEILRLATPVVAWRPGSAAVDGSAIVALGGRPPIVVAMPPTPVSSSAIRARLVRGEPAGDDLPPGVEAYAVNHRAYTGGG